MPLIFNLRNLYTFLLTSYITERERQESVCNESEIISLLNRNNKNYMPYKNSLTTFFSLLTKLYWNVRFDG